MKFIPIGQVFNGPFPQGLKASNFSNDQYEGVELLSGKKFPLVLIMRSKKTAPLEWMVAYGFSQIFFKTFREAMDFCKKQGFTQGGA